MLCGSGWAEGSRSSGLPERSAGLAGTARPAAPMAGGWRMEMGNGGGRRRKRSTRRLGLNEIIDMRDRELAGEGGTGGASAAGGVRGDGETDR